MHDSRFTKSSTKEKDNMKDDLKNENLKDDTDNEVERNYNIPMDMNIGMEPFINFNTNTFPDMGMIITHLMIQLLILSSYLIPHPCHVNFFSMCLTNIFLQSSSKDVKLKNLNVARSLYISNQEKEINERDWRTFNFI